jgi:hypothetical protein
VGPLPPCNPPTLPQPIDLAPVLNASETHATLTVEELRGLLDYLAAARAYITVMRSCVTVAKPVPLE